MVFAFDMCLSYFECKRCEAFCILMCLILVFCVKGNVLKKAVLRSRSMKVFCIFLAINLIFD